MPMLSDAFRRCPNDDAYVDRVARALAKRGEAPPRVDVRTVVAYLNNGRWVADCPNCRNGLPIHPEWTKTACRGNGCGRIFINVVVPENWRAIESTVTMRPVANRNWQDGESVEFLQGENVLHGYGEDVQRVVQFEIDPEVP